MTCRETSFGQETRRSSLVNWSASRRRLLACFVGLMSGVAVTSLWARECTLAATGVAFGDYDFLSIAEAPSETQMAAALLAAASGGGVTDLRTTLAMTSVEAKGVFSAASELAPGFKSAGGV